VRTERRSPQRLKPCRFGFGYGTAEQATEKYNKRGKSFLQGLKPVEGTEFTSVLKHRLPEEEDFSRSV
jgi:hypothetical protein